MMRVYIDEGDDRTAVFNETAPEINPCNVTELVVGDAQKFGKLHAVGAGLIEHDEELAVRQHGSRRVGLKEVVHVLRQPGTATSVLSDPFPERKQEVCAVFMHCQQLRLQIY